MTRRIITLLAVSMILAGLAWLLPTTAHAQSAGCTAVQGLSGFLAETFSRSTGASEFLAGDVITVNGVLDVGGGPAAMQLVVTGPTNTEQTGSTVSFTIPQAGSYNVTITNVSTFDAIVTATCAGGSAPAPEQPAAREQWTGYSDGRLNPDMTEAYSLYCSQDLLLIYRGDGAELGTLILNRVGGVPIGGQIQITDPNGAVMTLQRLDTDSYVLSGNNGNVVPGTKAFSLSDCYARNGSFQDDDFDGIRNQVDRCPTQTAPGQPFGCAQVDTDGDTVFNMFDRCPDTPGNPTAAGCPDADSDGVQDSEDSCPRLPGNGEPDGCPDRDGDGVDDPGDLCPDTAPADGEASIEGCPDTDEDGLIAPERTVFRPHFVTDQCPAVFGLPENDGCPEHQMTLFEFAAMTGSFTDIIVPTYQPEEESCNKPIFGGWFC